MCEDEAGQVVEGETKFEAFRAGQARIRGSADARIVDRGIQALLLTGEDVGGPRTSASEARVAGANSAVPPACLISASTLRLCR